MDKSGLKRSFKDTYYGNAVDGLYKHLEKCDEKHGPMHFARVISVIQSSGTGKSRTVLELSKRGVIILYINVRGPLDLNSFPNRDDIPADMLTSQLDDSEHDYNRRCLAFLMAVYATLRDFLDSYKRVAGTGGIAQRWNDSMCNLDSPDRDMFFSRMKRKYNLALKRLRDENAPKPNSGSQPEQLSSGVKALQVAYEALLNDFPTVFDRSSNHPKLVIAIDDAHTLNEVKGCKYRPMDVLCSTISTCLSVECSNWTLFVSTASHIADLVPTRGHQIGGDTHAPLLFPPYTLLGWDQMARPLSEISPLEVAQFSNIARFGRPLWYTLRKSTSFTDRILATAAIKLCKTNDPELALREQGLAVISQRFGLDITDGHVDSITYQQKAVRSHLRVCTETTGERVWPRTFYPSEPLLSCAAAQLLHEDQFSLCSALRCVRTNLKGGLVKVDQKLELVGRLLLLLAKDLCVRSTPGFMNGSGVGWKVELRDCKRVPVIAFLEFMFGTEALGDDAKERFKHWHVNFSHWISMSKCLEFEMTDRASDWTIRHWCRTSAVQGCRDQPLIDKVIPMYYYDPALEQATTHRVSHILVSDRAQKQHSKADLPSITRPGSIGCSTSEPYIAMLLDLGVTDQPVEFTMDSDESCLRIYAPGLTNSTYPRMDSEVLKTLSDILDVPKHSEYQRSVMHLQSQYECWNSTDEEHVEREAGCQAPE